MMICIQRSQDKQESAYFFFKLPRAKIILFVVECLERVTVESVQSD